MNFDTCHEPCATLVTVLRQQIAVLRGSAEEWMDRYMMASGNLAPTTSPAEPSVPHVNVGGIPFVIVEDPNMPPDQIEFRSANGQQVRVVNIDTDCPWCSVGNPGVYIENGHMVCPHRPALNRTGD
jgi:hypothetical protein